VTHARLASFLGSTTPPSDAARRRFVVRFLLPAALLLVTYGIAQIRWGELIAAGRGVGWDGRFYTPVVQDFRGSVFGRGLDSYRLQRVVPPGIVALGMKVFGVSTDEPRIVTAYAVYNLLLLLGVLVLWNDIADRMRIGERGRWLGFLLLFVNFSVLRVPFYVPVNTDPSALFLGALLLDFHLRNNGPGMLATLLVGAFTWPSFLAMGAPLYVFARPSTERSEEPLPPRHAWAAGGAVALLYVANVLTFAPAMELPSTVAPMARAWLPVSLVLVVAYLAFAYRHLLDDARLFRWEPYLECIRPRRLAVLLLVAIGIRLVVAALAGGNPPMDASLFRRYLALQPLMRPALFIVSHAVYLGVLPLLLVLRWRQAARVAHGLGVGFTLFLAGVMALSVITESRQLSNGLVALVLVAVLAFEDVRWPAWGSIVVVAIALVASKVWFGINHEGFLGRSSFLSYPTQYYFMHLGPWMAPENYRIQALAVTTALLLTALVVRHARTRAQGERAEEVRLPPHLLRVAAAVLGALLVLGVAEGIARWRLNRERTASADGDGSRSDPRLGWTNEPGAEIRVHGSEFDVDVRFNSLGLRGPERSAARVPGIGRILLLGDGFVEGYTVPEESTVRAVLERRLNEAGCPVEVWNAGAAGYSLDQEYLYFATEGRKYKADVVVLFFYSDDLVHSVRGPRGKPYLEVRDGAVIEGAEPRLARERLRQREINRVSLLPWRHSALLRYLSNASLEWPARYRAPLVALGAVEPVSPPAELSPYAITPESKGQWSLASALVGALDSGVRAEGATLTAVYVPASFEVDDDEWARLQERYSLTPKVWDRDKVERRFEEMTAALDLPAIDPRSALRTAREPTYLHAERLWTPVGHRVVAELLARHLGQTTLCRTRVPASHESASLNGVR
jgi:hypothetical protein